MNHDFAKNSKPPRKKPSVRKKTAATKPPPKSQVPGWVWLFTGIVTGIFISFLAYLADVVPERQETSPILEKTREVAAQAGEEITTRFDFYTLLPEREVLVPDEIKEAGNEISETFQYILQAGSFKSAADADRLRARLLLLGLDAKMEAVTGSNGETWHRVQVGPFLSRSKMSKARSTLIGEDIDTLLLKRKIES